LNQRGFETSQLARERFQRIEQARTAINRPKNSRIQSQQDRESAGFEARVTARDLMRACEATLRGEDSIERAAGVMAETNARSIPVVDGPGRLIGMITDRDITVKLVALGASIPHAQVSDCMNREAFACSPDASLEGCVAAMAWHQAGQLTIVDDDHKILGTINRSDLLCYVCEHPHTTEHREMLADMLCALAF
jgi:predicted transcriptional regulator